MKPCVTDSQKNIKTPKKHMVHNKTHTKIVYLHTNY